MLLRKQQMSLCQWEKGKEGVALARRENTEKQERKGGTTDEKHTERIKEPNVGSWPAKYLQSWRQMAT